MPFLQKELFPLGGFTVLMWHVLALVALILVLVIIIAIAVASSKKRRKEALQRQIIETPVTNAAVQTETANTEKQATEQPAEATTAEPVKEQASTEEQKPAEQPQQAKEKPVQSVKEEPKKMAEVKDKQEVEVEEKAEKARPKNYHISLRDDGKWQVKLGKGEKALKLFDTQAQAIAFAKEKAKNQEGHITIHKVDGKIRKQKY